jgi:Ni2+-binding GTPase involved in maturation of urease and hydrogenase
MKVITVAGAPSAGKTSVITYTARRFLDEGTKVAAVKFDALKTDDDRIYKEKLGIPAICGLSDYVCPDHYYVSNLEEVLEWGAQQKADYLFIETAGLCFRCAPHIEGVPAVTVIDNLSGFSAPEKMGPALALADAVLITKGDLVSQAEKEVFGHRVRLVNPKAKVFHVNGLTGNGSLTFKRLIDGWPESGELTGTKLRYSMPASICSYCTGEVRIGEEYQSGNVVKIDV